MTHHEKIYRVHAHDTTYEFTSPRYYIARSEKQLRDELETNYGNTLVIESVVEVTAEEVVCLLNLYIE